MKLIVQFLCSLAGLVRALLTSGGLMVSLVMYKVQSYLFLMCPPPCLIYIFFDFPPPRNVYKYEPVIYESERLLGIVQTLFQELVGSGIATFKIQKEIAASDCWIFPLINLTNIPLGCF